VAKAKVTPSRQQYLDVKRQYPDAIVFFRLGEFYETFDDHAHTTARELDLPLTSRPVSESERLPMAGVPHHAAESYIARLIAKGYKVALCEQMSSEPVGGLIPREVVRVFTAGTVIEPGMLDAGRNNYLAALIRDEGRLGLAYADITTGEFATTQLPNEQSLVEELARLAPAELILPEGEHGFQDITPAISRLPNWRFEEGNARQTLRQHFGVQTLDAFGCENKPAAIRAAGAILHYLYETQKGSVAQIQRLSTYSTAGYMALDQATRRNLELTQSLSGNRQASLLGVLDRTVTPMGARLLRQRVTRPLLDADQLNERLDEVEAFYEDGLLRADVRRLLKGLPDLERLANRAVSGQATPRDLENIGRVLHTLPDLQHLLAGQQNAPLAGMAGCLDVC